MDLKLDGTTVDPSVFTGPPEGSDAAPVGGFAQAAEANGINLASLGTNGNEDSSYEPSAAASDAADKVWSSLGVSDDDIVSGAEMLTFFVENNISDPVQREIVNLGIIADPSVLLGAPRRYIGLSEVDFSKEEFTRLVDSGAIDLNEDYSGAKLDNWEIDFSQMGTYYPPDGSEGRTIGGIVTKYFSEAFDGGVIGLTDQGFDAGLNKFFETFVSASDPVRTRDGDTVYVEDTTDLWKAFLDFADSKGGLDIEENDASGTWFNPTGDVLDEFLGTGDYVGEGYIELDKSSIIQDYSGNLSGEEYIRVEASQITPENVEDVVPYNRSFPGLEAYEWSVNDGTD